VPQALEKETSSIDDPLLCNVELPLREVFYPSASPSRSSRNAGQCWAAELAYRPRDAVRRCSVSGLQPVSRSCHPPVACERPL
jgi:hypothetical protein